MHPHSKDSTINYPAADSWQPLILLTSALLLLLQRLTFKNSSAGFPRVLKIPDDFSVRVCFIISMSLLSPPSQLWGQTRSKMLHLPCQSESQGAIVLPHAVSIQRNRKYYWREMQTTSSVGSFVFVFMWIDYNWFKAKHSKNVYSLQIIIFHCLHQWCQFGLQTQTFVATNDCAEHDKYLLWNVNVRRTR